MQITAPASSIQLEDHLKTHFGYNSFRNNQREIVQAILNGQDVVAILPTGAGKSICYQLPAMIMPGIAIVVSPLISLMQDQVLSLTKNGIAAAFLNSSLHVSDIRSVMNNLADYKLLYIAPERLTDEAFMQSLKQTQVSFFAIDEAHCISQWGHSFRPEYRQLSLLKNAFPQCPVIALTATATKEVEADMISQLSMRSPYTLRASFDRPNLTLRIDAKKDVFLQLQDFLQKHSGEPGIIYAATRKTVDETYAALVQKGFTVGKYHAGLPEKERTEAQYHFVHDQCPLMVATVAFGMGIHKPNIRFIVHLDMPRSIEQYYQEIGRGGRDGLPADCLMLYSGQDLRIYHSFLEDIVEEELKKNVKAKTDKMYGLCSTLSCRRKKLLHYFDETYPSSNCNGCDHCLDDTELTDETIAAQKILSCVYRVEQRFGVKHVVDVLKGSKSKAIIDRGHDRLSTYGLMREYTEPDLRNLIETLIELKFLQRSSGEYPVLQWSSTTPSVINGSERVLVRKKISLNQPKTLAIEYDKELFTQLSALRQQWAQSSQVPAFVIFSDKTLMEMASFYPMTKSAFLALNGAGPVKWEKYGQDFVDVIIAYCKPKGIVSIDQHVSKHKIEKQAPLQIKQDRLVSAKETARFYTEGMSLDRICQLRNLSLNTIIDHLCEIIMTGRNLDITPVVSKERQAKIEQVIANIGIEKLKPIKLMLPEDYGYDEIRLVVAYHHRNTTPQPF